ncbi:MAG TPA: hypothetical protein VGC89_05980 [Pyrinomonadaceae bacterium]
MAELFTNFEINKTTRWRHLARLTALSLVLHVAALAGMIFIPALRDVIDVARLISGAEYVDEDYDKTIIGERADLIQVSPEGKLSYPAGYFGTKQQSAAQLVAEAKPQPTPTPKPKPTPKPQPSPSPSPSATEGEKAADAAAIGNPQTKEDADKAIDEIAKKNNVIRPDEGKINKRPLRDWLAHANELKTKGKLDLSGTVRLVIIARRDKKGKLHDAQVKAQSGDEALAAVARDLVSAISDSNVLYFLEDSGEGEVRFDVMMNQSLVTASVAAEVDSVERAQKLASTYGLMLLGGKIAKSGRDEAVIYENTRTSSSGKQVIVKFSMSRQTAGEMLKKQLPST